MTTPATHPPRPATAVDSRTGEPLLELIDVCTHFPIHRGFLFQKHIGVVKAVDGVSFSLNRGEVLGLVGESGCGKSTLARTIVRLEQPTSGKIRLAGRDFAAMPEAELRRARTDVQMIFQDPYSSLNPRMTIFDTLAEPLLVHGRATKGDVAGRVATLMDRVGMSGRAMRKYPHEFSGGQRQRIAIARALALEPRLIIADEPVSALDVSIQAQVINLLAQLVREMGLSMIFISHDLSVVKHVSNRVAMMYLGRIVEFGSTADLIERPMHPYTQALISAVPIPDPARERSRQRLVPPGDPPSPLNPPPGCPFHPRCPHAIDKCQSTVPPLETQTDGRLVACLRVGDLSGL